jgi:hypothetical protein
MSSRYGTIIINRDPAGAGTSNHYFTQPVTSLSRLTFQGSAWRYAGLADGSLQRRSGNTQGAYTQLTLPTTVTGTQVVLSGQPFESIVQSCFETSQAYLFIYDQNASIKDQGTGNPQLTGIDPSPYTLNVLPYAPLLIMIDNFATGNVYTNSGMSAWGYGALDTLDATYGTLITDFSQFYGISLSTGGGTRYPSTGFVTGSSGSVSQTGAGTNTVTTSAGGGFASVVPSTGQMVTIYVDVSSNWSVSGAAYVYANYEYSVDGGATWTTFYNTSASSGSGTHPTSQMSFVVGVSNLNLIQFQIVLVAQCFPSGTPSCSLTTAITNPYAVVSNPGAFGPIANGMIALLNTNTQVTIPISSVTSQTLVGGIYTQLLVNTTAAHGLVANFSANYHISYGCFSVRRADWGEWRICYLHNLRFRRCQCSFRLRSNRPVCFSISVADVRMGIL